MPTAEARSYRCRLLATVTAALASMGVWSHAPATGRAAESDPVRSPRATVSLVSDVDTVQPGATFRLGLRQQLAPHWHTYWKNPGDAGTPPSVQLTLPEGAEAEDVAWPGPERLPAGPVVSFGYEKAVLLPIRVRVPDTAEVGGEPFVVEAEADWLVCREDCIPEEGKFRLELPVTAQEPAATPDPAVAAAFERAAQRLPRPLPGAARFVVEGDALSLHADGFGDRAGAPKEAFFFPSAWGVVEHAAPQLVSRDAGALSIAMRQGPAFDASASVAGVLAVSDAQGQTRWFEVPESVPVTSAAVGAGGPNAPPAPQVEAPLWQTLLFALLGGLLLNLMPCVFPVLAIKANGLVQLGRDDRAEVRRESLWYTAGVLVAFVSLAGVLLALRAGGEAVGWGFQFQSPLFVAAMGWLLLALGLNLSGVYELGLSLGGTGQQLADRPGAAGSFFTGLLAVVVATPCTAPFMGAALGAALLAPPLVCLGLFLVMGVGLALPYTTLGVFPKLASHLPRPGAWMVRVRQALAFPMYGSAAWLLWVLARQTGEGGLRVALAGCVLTALACWLYGVTQVTPGRRWPVAVLAAATAATVVALAASLDDRAQTAASTAAASGADAQAFDPARLSALREQGIPVFVNMTADWCITCLVNERATLGSARVQTAMREHGVAYMKGDWTRRDPAITEYLHRFERDGVPFYAVYPSSGAPPEVLPSVLTVNEVLDALERAAVPRVDPSDPNLSP